MKRIPKKAIVTALLMTYVTAFLVVHTSEKFRRPAANMMYWYYSDNRYLEAAEFYGFWPLRHLGYHVPGFKARHNLERQAPPSDVSNDL